MRSVQVMADSALPLLGRRAFIGGAAAFVIGFAFPKKAAAMLRPDQLGRAGALDAAASGFDGFVPDGFIRISEDNRIILIVPSSEMGQGIATDRSDADRRRARGDSGTGWVAWAPADLKAYSQSLLNNQITVVRHRSERFTNRSAKLAQWHGPC